MAKTIIITDDFNGDEGAQTYRALIDGKNYEIDLTPENFKKYFREVENVESKSGYVSTEGSEPEMPSIKERIIESAANAKNVLMNDVLDDKSKISNEESSEDESSNEATDSPDSSDEGQWNEFRSFSELGNILQDKISGLFVGEGQPAEPRKTNSDDSRFVKIVEELASKLKDDSSVEDISYHSQLREEAKNLRYNVEPAVNEESQSRGGRTQEDDSNFINDLQSQFDHLGLPFTVVGFADTLKEKGSHIKDHGTQAARQGLHTAKTIKNNVKNTIKQPVNSNSSIPEFLKDFLSASPKLEVTSEILSLLRRDFSARRAAGYSRDSVWMELLAKYGRYKIDQIVARKVENTVANINAFTVAFNQIHKFRK